MTSEVIATLGFRRAWKRERRQERTLEGVACKRLFGLLELHEFLRTLRFSGAHADELVARQLCIRQRARPPRSHLNKRFEPSMLREFSDLLGMVDVKLDVVDAAAGVADLMEAAAAMGPPPNHGTSDVALTCLLVPL